VNDVHDDFKGFWLKKGFELPPMQAVLGVCVRFDHFSQQNSLRTARSSHKMLFGYFEL
jgi:hypothetical protein